MVLPVVAVPEMDVPCSTMGLVVMASDASTVFEPTVIDADAALCDLHAAVALAVMTLPDATLNPVAVHEPLAAVAAVPCATPLT